MKQTEATNKPGWLLFFYTVPSKPVSNRVRVWRKLMKAGAVQLKGAVYIFPNTEEHYELLQWLVSEIISMKGDGTFAAVETIETMKEKEIIDLFNHQRESDYHAIEKQLDELERKIQGVKKRSGSLKDRKLFEEFGKYQKEFDDVKRIDFFSSKTGDGLRKKIRDLEIEIRGLTGNETQKPTAEIKPRNEKDYRNKIWVTRKKPFIDRIASAWLIRKSIDPNAAFSFTDDEKNSNLDKNMIAFDVKDGEFTHVGDMCTFEVLIKTFGLKDKVIKKMAEIIHDLDLKDGKYQSAEAKGLEDILIGIRKTAKDDRDILSKGMAVFDMFYASRTQ